MSSLRKFRACARRPRSAGFDNTWPSLRRGKLPPTSINIGQTRAAGRIRPRLARAKSENSPMSPPKLTEPTHRQKEAVLGCGRSGDRWPLLRRRWCATRALPLACHKDAAEVLQDGPYGVARTPLGHRSGEWSTDPRHRHAPQHARPDPRRTLGRGARGPHATSPSRGRRRGRTAPGGRRSGHAVIAQVGSRRTGSFPCCARRPTPGIGSRVPHSRPRPRSWEWTWDHGPRGRWGGAASPKRLRKSSSSWATGCPQPLGSCGGRCPCALRWPQTQLVACNHGVVNALALAATDAANPKGPMTCGVPEAHGVPASHVKPTTHESHRANSVSPLMDLPKALSKPWLLWTATPRMTGKWDAGRPGATHNVSPRLGAPTRNTMPQLQHQKTNGRANAARHTCTTASAQHACQCIVTGTAGD